MPRPISSGAILARVFLLSVAISLSGGRGEASVVLTNSAQPVSAVTGGSTSGPYISRATLTPAETSAPLTFEVALKMRHAAELQTRIGKGERVSPAEMAAKYLPSAADYQSVVAWAQAQGFTIVRRDPRHLILFLRAPVGQIGQSLGVKFARVTFQGKEYTSATNAPTVPDSISPLLIGINGLQPHLHPHRHIERAQVHPEAANGAAPYTPAQIATAYGINSLYGTNLTGGGQSVAIVIDTFPSTTDLEAFWSQAGVNQSIANIVFVQAVVGTLPSPSGEETLDTEWASGMAPGAHVRVYAATDLSNVDLDQAYQTVLDDATNHPEYGLHQMSMSYGEGETYTTQSQVNTDDALFIQLANAGVTCFAASGDGGSTPGPQGGGDRSGPTQVDSPASDPYVAGVGGTTLQLNTANAISSEVVWNNSSGASGGGTSIWFARPAWQTAPSSPQMPGVTTGSLSPSSMLYRVVPDVAAAGDPDYGALFYFGGISETIGGTSWSSPTWAGICALINQARQDAGQAPLGNLGPNIYPILNGSSYAGNFNDVTSGNNGLRFNTGYSAGTGYDPVTGLGSPKGATLAQTLIGQATLMGVQMPAALWTAQPGESAQFNVAAAGGSAGYQWQRKPAGSASWSNLSDSGAYSGSGSGTLTITNATTAMNGDLFQCQITLGSTVVTSTPSVLTVNRPLIISTLAGTADTPGDANGAGATATFQYPSGVACDASGNIYVADYLNNEIRKVTSTGTVTTPYGDITATPPNNTGSANGVGNAASFDTPNAVAFDASGNLYVADTGNNLIRKIASGTVTTFAGAGGHTFSLPNGVAVDGSGNVYVADTGHDVIRKITPGGSVSLFAGTSGTAGYADGAAGQAEFNTPTGVAVDSTGAVYVADFGNFVVRKIVSGTVTTLAGQAEQSGYFDGPGATALFNAPSGVWVDSSLNVYVTDALIPPIGSNAAGNDLVRVINPSGIVSTLAGQAGTEGSASGTGSAAQFYSLQNVTQDANGTFYFADTYNQQIRKGTFEPPPTVTVTATQPLAEVFGPTPGIFTFTRTGTTTAALTVTYSIGGSGISGTDYEPIGTSALIPAGSSTGTVAVTPIENTGATPTVTLTLDTGSPAFLAGNPDSATLSIEEITAYQTWKESEFGADATNPAIGGDDADPNHNGVPNLLEYAFGSDPLQAGTDPQPQFSVTTVDGSDYLTLTYTQINNDPNLTCTVQVTSDLSGKTDTWHSGSSATTVVSSVVNGNLTTNTVRDNTAFTSGIKRFIRVHVTGS